MPPKSQQLQIRVTPEEKKTLRRLASAAGQDLSSYVLSRALPRDAVRCRVILDALAGGEDPRFGLAELNDFLAGLSPARFLGAVEGADVSMLSADLQNYVAAMVELAANRYGSPPPAWTTQIVPPPEPHFAVSMKSLRPHLLKASPVAFKRRNLFVDASVGDRV